MSLQIRRVIWIVLDGVGAGALPDAGQYGDSGSNTLGHALEVEPEPKLPNLQRLGLGRLPTLKGLLPPEKSEGAHGIMAEVSPGKDSTTGHWELAGVVLGNPFPLYPDGFPGDVVREFEERIGRGVLGNKHASGTEIIEELGEEHRRTGRPILYTSADSVFQLAAHKDVIPLDELYRICRVAREMLRGEHGVSRVIARPFVGDTGSFKRVGAERLDLSLPPPRPTVLDLTMEAGLRVRGVGKVGDIYAGRSFESSPHTSGNLETMERILRAMREIEAGIIMANLVDFDMLWGHRRDVSGFARGLEEFDAFLPRLRVAMDASDLCLIVSDHGCDPTFRGTDHTREYALLLLFGDMIAKGVDLGTRTSFADCGRSIADLLSIDGTSLDGTSFAEQVLVK